MFIKIIDMYKVFISNEGPMVMVAKDIKQVDAIQFAINLHRSFNVPHTVMVADSSSDMKIVLTLEMK